MLGGDHSLPPVLKAIEDGCLREGNAIREFYTNSEGEKHKQRAFTFRRTAIPSYLRKHLDDSGREPTTSKSAFLLTELHFLLVQLNFQSFIGKKENNVTFGDENTKIKLSVLGKVMISRMVQIHEMHTGHRRAWAGMISKKTMLSC